jgi:hypothetical protein
MWHCQLIFSVDNGKGLNQRLRNRLIAAGFKNSGTGRWVISKPTLAEVHVGLDCFWQLVIDPHGQVPDVQLDANVGMDWVTLYFFKD